MVFCNTKGEDSIKAQISVTILILIDGFLQFITFCGFYSSKTCHNPYFNRWFSAILANKVNFMFKNSHNPYFNRWFSAIRKASLFDGKCGVVTILILIDGFLQ